MKRSLRTAYFVLALAPAAAMAQTQPADTPVSHAQQMNQLTQLRQAGYVPSKIHYPADIQSAQARAATQAGSNAAAISGVGGATTGVSQSGARAMPTPNWRSMYGRH